jgi:osmoprotectant transport system ATP-binding protein
VNDRPLLALTGVAKRYAGDTVLADIDLAITAGSFVALVGASGSGKTTLLKTINRLRPADSGRILLDGRDVATIPPAELRRSIGYVFQGIGLFPHMTVAENIAIVPRLTGIAAAERQARVGELLSLVALPAEMARRCPGDLSGGQAQRVGMARALAASPALMLMDEPFGALDPVTRDDIGQAYRALHDKLGLTTVMVTHDMTEALLIADRILVLGAGRIVADSTPAELIAGHPDPAVAALIAVPRRQAERLAALARR